MAKSGLGSICRLDARIIRWYANCCNDSWRKAARPKADLVANQDPLVWASQSHFDKPEHFTLPTIGYLGCRPACDILSRRAEFTAAIAETAVA